MISQDLQEAIVALTTSDRKDLTGKALKTADESGALAQQVLSFMSAGAHLHKFPNRAALLEKAVNVVLCGLSVLKDPSVAASDEEIGEIVSRQVRKWADLQQGELLVSERIPFEAHVTVRLPNMEADTVQSFRDACQEIGVKPIVLRLENRGVEVMQDVMTSSVHMGTNTTAITYVYGIRDCLLKRGFDVVRCKLETVPWHPASPKKAGDVMPKDCYFECHFGIHLEAESAEDMEDQITDLRRFSKVHGLHVSANAFKNTSPTSKVFMATLRSDKDTKTDFDDRVKGTKAALEGNMFTVEKVIIEFAVFDDRKSHDGAWTKA